MSVVQGYKRNGTQKYKDNQTLFVVLVCIAKLIKLLVDLIIHYLFFNFIVFFLNFRKLEQRKLSCFNYLILGIVMVLFFGGIQLLSIGVVSVYISKIYREIKKRPLYIIDETVNIDPDL